jgi:large subunit ribosomal protein L29
MKVEDIRELDGTELEARLKELTEEQFKLRFQSSMMQLENPSLVKKIRRDIARIRTVLRERELAKKE